ncbi:MAG TPA: hypothetical protein PLO06_00645 [Methanoregulaceae archaeon]|nr:hypothetical protein [Methanoregulaceae archaeon]HPD75304.1 hypothetical protein [Methanoregulaceae archaeon]
MKEFIIFGLGIVGIFSVLSSLALLQLGIIIDRFPTKQELYREKSLSSPVASTRIFVVIFWLMFALGAYALLQGGTFMLIAGITTIFSISLFILTALVFSFAVYSTMRHQSNRDKDVMPVIMTETVNSPAAAPRKPMKSELPSPGHIRRRPTGNFLIDSLLRRD